MTTRVTSAPAKAPAAASANTRPSAPAAAAPHGKTFNHVLGHARAHAATASGKAGAKQAATSKTTAAKGQQAPVKGSGGKGKSTASDDAASGRAQGKKPAATDPSTKAKVAAGQNEVEEPQETEQAPVVKGQVQAAKEQPGDEKKDATDERQSPEEKPKQDQSQPDPSLVQLQMPVNPMQVTANVGAGNSSDGDLSSGVTKVSDLSATPRAEQRANDAPAIATSGKTATGDKASGLDATMAASGAGVADDSAGADEVPAAVTHAAPVVVGKTDESAAVNPAITSGQELKTAVTHSVSPAAVAATPAPAANQFAEANHGNIVSGIHGQLFPNGGTMQIRLDPPALGPLHITVKIENGVLSATFQTSSDQASKLLSHSLGELKQTLEAQGVTINRLHVEQAGKGEASNGKSGEDSSGQDESQEQGEAQRRGSEQDQQRREMLQRMWRRIAGGGDPLDLVA